MVIPHLTENYGASRDAPEKEAPQCAVHNFPHNIDQCLVLAQSEFVGNFDTAPPLQCFPPYDDSAESSYDENTAVGAPC